MCISIPSYIKYILEYCGYNNFHAIATIEESDLEYFKNEVREGKVTNFFEGKIGTRDTLEGSSKSVENFEFSRGHQKLLMAIVKLVKENLDEKGVESFSQELLIPTKRKTENKTQKTIHSKKQKFEANEDTKLDRSIEPSSFGSSTHENSDIQLKNHRSTLIKKMVLSLINHAPETFASVSRIIIEI